MELLQKVDTSPQNKTLIFTGTKVRSEMVARALYSKRIRADCLHGGMNQRQRDNVLHSESRAEA
jgi:superfamily II DNA/RNA helicase